MNELYFLKTIIPLGIGTLFIRCSFIFLGNKVRISNFTREIFTYIPAAVLPALAVPMVYYHEGFVEVLQNKERLVAFVFGLFICLLSRNILITIVSGLVSLYLLRLIL